MIFYAPYTYSQQNIARDDFVRISFIEGNGLVHHGFNQNDEQATINSMMMGGDTFEIYNDSRAELVFANGIVIRMNGGSKIQLLSLKGEKSHAIIVKLIGGEIIADSSIASIRENSFRVDTPDCSIYMMQEGYFRVVSSQYTDVMVYNGSIEVATENNTFSLSSGQRLSNVALPDTQPEYFNTFSNDDFSQWNESRQSYYDNKKINDEYSNNIDPYDMTELDDYGNWKYEPEYGNVWVPYVTSEWRPYMYGSWSWYPSGWGWTSYEPWGWAPYHYGRWGFGASIGWFWIPRPVFGLGWVSWYSWDNYIGWCPLDHHDRPMFFDHYAGNGHYYRPNLRSWTVIPKTRIGYRDVYKYRLEDNEKIGAMVINKDNLMKTTQFTYRPKTLPGYKYDSNTRNDNRYNGQQDLKGLYRKPMEKIDRNTTTLNGQNKGNWNGNDAEFKRFKQNIEKYNPKSSYDPGNRGYTAPYDRKYNKSYDNKTSTYPKSYEDRNYRGNYPSYQKPYNQQNKNEIPEYKRYYRNDNGSSNQSYPRSQSYPYYKSTPNYNGQNREHISPSYKSESNKVFENFYKQRGGTSTRPDSGSSNSSSGSHSSYSGSHSSSSSRSSSSSSHSSSSHGGGTPAKRK